MDMKKILIFSAALVALASCTAKFEEINRPGGTISKADFLTDGYGPASFLVQLQNQSFPEQENTYQMNVDLIGNYCGRFMTYANNGFSNTNFAKMNAPEGWVRYPFADCTPKLKSAYNELMQLVEEGSVEHALGLLFRTPAYLRLTDIYGPYPMGLVEGDDLAYSSQEDVYMALFADLDKAIEILAAHAGERVNAAYDQVYGGDLSQWYKFANSLKLRMAIRIRFADPEKAKRFAEEAVAAGVITDNADNCMISYNPNGQYKTSVEWGDSRACADIEAFMNGYGDPRITQYFEPAKTEADRAIVGCPAAANIGNKAIADNLYSAAKIGQTDRGVWMTAAEITFCRAEGALAGWNMGGSVKDLYEQAVRLSFAQWGAGSADAYLADETSTQNDYVNVTNGYGGNYGKASTITIKWDDQASEEVKLERLITQKWIALFPEGEEAWCEIRRTGYPKVFAPAQSNSYGLKVPNRVPFDPREAQTNKANYEKAVQLLGGSDNYATKLWWQR